MPQLLTACFSSSFLGPSLEEKFSAKAPYQKILTQPAKGKILAKFPTLGKFETLCVGTFAIPIPPARQEVSLVFDSRIPIFSGMVLLPYHILRGRGKLPNVIENLFHCLCWRDTKSSICLNEGEPTNHEALATSMGLFCLLFSRWEDEKRGFRRPNG